MLVLPSFVISDAPGMIGGRRMSSRLWALLVFAFSKHSMVSAVSWDCSEGTYYTTDPTTCFACQPGTYQNLQGQPACKNCSAGTFSKLQGLKQESDCKSCTAGRYSENGATICTNCAAGKYSAAEGATVCTSCTAGKYFAATVSELTCAGSCPNGCTPSLNAASGTISDGDGLYLNDEFCSWILKTPPGTEVQVSFSQYSIGMGDDVTIYECDAAPCEAVHTFTSQQTASPVPIDNVYRFTGGILKVIFQSDHYSTSKGFTGHWFIPQMSESGCVDCAAGKFSGASAASTCADCGAGTYSSTAGSSTCAMCNAGMYSTTASTCTNCAAGKFSGASGASAASTCADCAAGTYSSTAGSSTCTICNAGMYSTTASTCTHCAAGKFSGASGASAASTCADCGAGKFSATGADVCTNCGAGTFSETAGTSTCTNCAAGSYSTSEGASAAAVCISCPATKTSPAGSGSCKCPAGSSWKPAQETQYRHFFDTQFQEIAPGQFADITLAKGVNVSVSWDTLEFELHTADAVSMQKDKFNAVTVVFVPETFSHTLTYTCSGCKGSGHITLVPVQNECTKDSDAYHRVFASRGKLDDRGSCQVQCAAGFYRTHPYMRGWRCKPHWKRECGVGEYLVEGTQDSNALCEPCSGCAGKKLLRNCTATTDDQCLSCGESSLGHIWTNKHGEPCQEDCLTGFVLNTRTRVCERCSHRCPAGSSFPLWRDNCTHCAACAELGKDLPVGAVWDTADDRQDCVATCTAGYALVNTPEGLQCTSTRRIAGPRPALTRCAQEGAECLLPGCTLDEEACTSCWDLPEDRRMGLFAVESEELKPGAWLASEADKQRYRWQFLAGCEWACLSDWVQMLSEDGRYYKCESREKAQATLELANWDPYYIRDAWEDDKSHIFLTQSRLLTVVAVLAFPLALAVCGICIAVGRECRRRRPRAKAKV